MTPDDGAAAPASSDAALPVATALAGILCGARLVKHELGVIPCDSAQRCQRRVKPPRVSGCCDSHRVRLWDERHPRVRDGQLPPHSLRRRQDSTAIRDQILGLISDGAWHTVWELAELCRCMETTASAKLRDLRKRQFGGFNIQSRRLPDSAAYEYRLVKAAV